jgi:hypothetical protein
MSTLLLASFLVVVQPSPSPSPSPSPGASPSPRPSPSPVSARRATLAEVAARKPPAAKKSPPAKVLTNDDLDKARTGDAPVSVLSVDGVEPPEGDRPVMTEGGVVPDAVQDEATWRQRAEAARAVLKDATGLVEAHEQRLAELRDDVNPEDPMNPFRQQTREAEIIAATERLETSRAEVAAARQALSDLEDEARRQRVPPGWLREP